MKKIINFLPVAAILLASGLAVATTTPVATPQWGYRNGNWEEITPGYRCLKPSEENCTATHFENGVPQGIVEGDYTI